MSPHFSSRQRPEPDGPIAFVTAGLGAGGAEQVIAQLARHECDRGRRVDVITFDRPGDRVFHELPGEAGVIRLGQGRGFAGTAGRVLALRRSLRERRPSLVVSFLTKINLVAALAVLGSETRLVCAERNNPELQDAHPLWNRMLVRAYRRADAIVCQTDAVRRCFPAAVRERLVTIPNPVPAPDVEPSGRGGRIITAVGRLTRQKGFDVLVDAFAAMAAGAPGWRLEIWGEGPERPALDARIERAGMTGRILLRGLSERPRGWIADTALFVLPSRYEGFPNALGEAMVAGIPAIAADCDFGPAEMISHGRSGWLVPTESREALAEALARLTGDAAMRASLGREAAIAMRRFSSPSVLAQWHALFERIGAAPHGVRHGNEPLVPAGIAR